MTSSSHSSQSSSVSIPANSLVCVIDDDDSILKGLSRLFRSASITAETFSSASAYLSRDVHEGPCCVVLDVQMPGVGGLELQKKLGDRGEQIVFITGHGDVPMCAGAMKAGAVDFLAKPFDDDDLLAAVSRALSRSYKMRRAMMERREARERLDLLTPRELEVMRGVIAGLLNKQIAAELGAAEKTIKTHRGRVMEKAGVDSVADLVRLAQAAGFAQHQ
jgi:FixJ family two-component response regulator